MLSFLIEISTAVADVEAALFGEFGDLSYRLLHRDNLRKRRQLVRWQQDFARAASLSLPVWPRAAFRPRACAAFSRESPAVSRAQVRISGLIAPMVEPALS